MASLCETQPDVLEEGGVRKAICGYTWPGIEFGEPPSCPYTFFEYVDAIRVGDLPRFKRIEAACQGWWFPTLDRGAGALLHVAADHGQLVAARYLLQQRGVQVNQRAAADGWTPLHRCARAAHYRHAPFMQLFECLLAEGADPTLRTAGPPGDSTAGLTAVELAVRKGHGWEEGEVRRQLELLIEQHKGTPKQPAFTYGGLAIGREAARVLSCWEAQPKLYPPPNWRPPPAAGFMGAAGMRRIDTAPWRPAGDGDGSCTVRPMTEAELKLQAQLC